VVVIAAVLDVVSARLDRVWAGVAVEGEGAEVELASTGGA
jgi:hypothetical protein